MVMVYSYFQCWDCVIERLEDPRNGTGEITHDYRVHRYNRTIHTFSGQISYSSKVAADPENYFVNNNLIIESLNAMKNWIWLQITVDAFISARGNNQYTKLPFRIPKMTLCSFYNEPYRKYMMPSMKPPAADYLYTDDPNKDICQILKDDGGVRILHMHSKAIRMTCIFPTVSLQKVYPMNNVIVDKSTFPPFLATGIYKVVFTNTYGPNDEVDSYLITQIRVY